MTSRLSLVIAWACTALLLLVPLLALYLLTDLASLAEVVRNSMGLPIRWQTVADGQWYAFWVLTVGYLSIGLVGIYFLRRAFVNFARGEFFNIDNSRDLRRFSILLLVQAVVTPVHFMISSVLLSLHHPAGQKVLSVSFGSNELRSIGVALVLWVISNLLVEGCRLQTENQQFI